MTSRSLSADYEAWLEVRAGLRTANALRELLNDMSRLPAYNTSGTHCNVKATLSQAGELSIISSHCRRCINEMETAEKERLTTYPSLTALRDIATKLNSLADQIAKGLRAPENSSDAAPNERTADLAAVPLQLIEKVREGKRISEGIPSFVKSQVESMLLDLKTVLQKLDVDRMILGWDMAFTTVGVLTEIAEADNKDRLPKVPDLADSIGWIEECGRKDWLSQDGMYLTLQEASEFESTKGLQANGLLASRDELLAWIEEAKVSES